MDTQLEGTSEPRERSPLWGASRWRTDWQQRVKRIAPWGKEPKDTAGPWRATRICRLLTTVGKHGRERTALRGSARQQGVILRGLPVGVSADTAERGEAQRCFFLSARLSLTATTYSMLCFQRVVAVCWHLTAGPMMSFQTTLGE